MSPKSSPKRAALSAVVPKMGAAMGRGRDEHEPAEACLNANVV